jgi:hypothetical protein
MEHEISPKVRLAEGIECFIDFGGGIKVMKFLFKSLP